jgi:hypothetical protein
MTDMKKRTVTIGVIVLVVGIVMLVGGAIGALGSITINTTFTQPHPGEYVSSEIMLNTTSSLVVSSPAASGGIVQAQDLNSVNATNVNAYAVPYNASGAGSDVYRSLSGDYYYVAFAPAQPDTRIVATPQGSLVLAFGALALLGIVLAIVGIVIAVVGVLRKGPPAVAGQT